MVFEVVHQYLEVLFWLFDVVAWHTSEEQTKTKGNMSFSDIFFCREQIPCDLCRFRNPKQ